MLYYIWNWKMKKLRLDPYTQNRNVMKIKELEKKLKHEGIRADVYSLYGADYDERLVLSQIGNGKWQVYYSERGLKTGLKEYQNEDDACDAFLAILLNDPLTKRR